MSLHTDSTAIVVGYNGAGGIRSLCELFHRYGFHSVFALVDRRDLMARLLNVPGLEIVEVHDILNAKSLAATIRSIVGYREVPFLCLQDTATFAYLAARKLLYGSGETRYHVPIDAILRARIKPSARLCWNRAYADTTKWTILGDSRRANERWSHIGGLQPVEGASYIVKPICGTASEMVSREISWPDVEAAAARIRDHFDTAEIAASSEHVQRIDGEEYHLYRDVIVEEFLQGAHYTLDGYSSTNDVSVVVQHKETIWTRKFLGDGGIYSPPDPSLKVLSPVPPLEFTGKSTTPAETFDDFVRKSVMAIGLRQWSFHGEAVVTADGNIHYVELNPRSPGGLLWRTAGLHLGIDPDELIVRSHLRIPSNLVKRNWVTVQFPIYAEEIGIIDAVEGAEEARKINFVEFIQAVKEPGDEIKYDKRENYAAFVCIHAPNHPAAREAEQKVRSVLRVRYRQPQ
jgi:hypothetical protein